MTLGKGIAIAGIWIGLGVSAYGSPGFAAIALIAAFILTVGALAQENNFESGDE
jgi:hypothetical protein